MDGQIIINMNQKIDRVDAICQKRKENKENQTLDALTSNLNCTQESLDCEKLRNWGRPSAPE